MGWDEHFHHLRTDTVISNYTYPQTSSTTSLTDCSDSLSSNPLTIQGKKYFTSKRPLWTIRQYLSAISDRMFEYPTNSFTTSNKALLHSKKDMHLSVILYIAHTYCKGGTVRGPFARAKLYKTYIILQQSAYAIRSRDEV